MAEKKYIEREAAISSLDELEKTSHHNSVLWPDHVEECREALRSIPAADVRPVVLCRDCKSYQQSHYIDNHMECARSGFPVHSVDFCSFGEKREEN